MQEQYALFYARTCGALVALLIGIDGVEGVFLCEVDIADSVVYLVEVLLVVVIAGHATQLANHLLGVPVPVSVPVIRHHLGHGDVGIETQFVGGMLAYHFTECSVRLLIVPLRSFYLS